MKWWPPWAQNIIFVHNFPNFPNSPKNTKTIKRHFTSNYMLGSATHKFRTLPNRHCHFVPRNHTLFTHDFLHHSRRTFFFFNPNSVKTQQQMWVWQDWHNDMRPHTSLERGKGGRERLRVQRLPGAGRLKGTVKGNEWRNYCSKNSTSDNIPAHLPLQNASNMDVLSENVFRTWPERCGTRWSNQLLVSYSKA